MAAPLGAGEQRHQQSPSPENDPSAIPLPHAHTLLSSFGSFLTVAIHNILYYRGIYPSRTFLSARAFDLPVQQNRHPLVCAWVRDAVDAVSAQIANGAVERVAVVLHAPPPAPPPPPPPPPPAPPKSTLAAGAGAGAPPAGQKPAAGPVPEPEPRSGPSTAVASATVTDSEKMPPPPRPPPRTGALAAALLAESSSKQPAIAAGTSAGRTVAAAAAAAAAAVRKAPELPPGAVLERWMFDVSYFPAWPGGAEAMQTFWQDRAAAAAQKKRERREAMRNAAVEGDEEDDDGDDEYDEDFELLDFQSDEEDEDGDEPMSDRTNENEPVNWADVNQQLRGALARLAHAGEKMGHLPPGCTFTIAVELRDDAPAPIGHPQPWIPSPPSLQQPTAKRPRNGRDLGGAKTTAVRSVEAGPLFFECWVEEGRAKDKLPESVPKPQPKALTSGK